MIVRAKQHIACVTIFIVYYQGLGRQFFAFAMDEKKRPISPFMLLSMLTITTTGIEYQAICDTTQLLFYSDLCTLDH